MNFSTATYYLAALVAILVEVTTSLPRSPLVPRDGRSRRKHHWNDPFDYQTAKGCPGVGAIQYHTDVELKLLKRDAQSPESQAAALDPRKAIDLPCDLIIHGGQSDTF